MFFSWSQFVAVLAAAGVGVHVIRRLSCLPGELRHLREKFPRARPWLGLALALWVEAACVVIGLAGTEFQYFHLAPSLAKFARIQCLFFVVVWGCEAAFGPASRARGRPLTPLLRLMSGVICLGWVCGFILCVKYGGWTVTPTSNVLCPFFTLDVILGLFLGVRYVAELGQPGSPIWMALPKH